MADLVHLNNHHRDTLEKIDQHPTSRNIDYRAATALLEHVADDVTIDGNKTRFVIAGQELVLNRPADGKTLDVQQVVDVRNYLAQAGYTA